MKKKAFGSAGTVIIGSKAHRNNHGRHDPWTTHAPYPAETEVIQGASGTWFLMLMETLLDGVQYHYPFAAFATRSEALDFDAQIGHHWFPNSEFIAVGEDWNFNLRPGVWDKVADLDLSDWQTAN